MRWRCYPRSAIGPRVQARGPRSSGDGALGVRVCGPRTTPRVSLREVFAVPRYAQKVLLSGLVALAAVALGACGRSEHVMRSVSGPGRSGVNPQVVSGCPTLNGNTLNSADAFTLETGSVP